MNTETVYVERVENKIELLGWIGPRTPALCKSVPGARFKREPTSRWVYPLDMSVCRALRRAFADTLVIGPALREWATDAVAAERTLAGIAEAEDAELRNVARCAPAIADAMATRTYQRVAAAFGARAGSFLLSDQPGLGKTIETLGALVEASPEGGAVLVVCPLVAVRGVWAPEVARWLGDKAEVFPVSGTRAKRLEILAAAGRAVQARRDGGWVFVIVNPEMVRTKKTTATDGASGRKRVEYEPAFADLFGIEWDAVICDESHRALIKAGSGETLTRRGMSRLSAKRRIALSGTPMRGKPNQLWGTLNWLRPDVFTSYWNWTRAYFEVTSNPWSAFVVGGLQSDGDQRLAADLRAYSLRRTKAEVLAELPPKSYAGSYLIPGDESSPFGVWLDMDPKQAKLYTAMQREGAVKLANGELIASGVLAEMTRLKQFAGAAGEITTGRDGEPVFVPAFPSPKFDWLVEKLTELGIAETDANGNVTGEGEGTAKLVVASQFTKLLNLFAQELRKLNIPVFLLTGETNEKNRVAMMQDFQSENSSARVFLLNTKAGGVAITLDAADDLVILDETWIPDDQEQVEDRIHRTSRLHNVTISYLRCLGTIEEEIAWITAARESVQKYLLDGARGVEAARKLYAAKAAA